MLGVNESCTARFVRRELESMPAVEQARHEEMTQPLERLVLDDLGDGRLERHLPATRRRAPVDQPLPELRKGRVQHRLRRDFRETSRFLGPASVLWVRLSSLVSCGEAYVRPTSAAGRHGEALQALQEELDATYGNRGAHPLDDAEIGQVYVHRAGTAKKWNCRRVRAICK